MTPPKKLFSCSPSTVQVCLSSGWLIGLQLHVLHTQLKEVPTGRCVWTSIDLHGAERSVPRSSGFGCQVANLGNFPILQNMEMEMEI